MQQSTNPVASLFEILGPDLLMGIAAVALIAAAFSIGAFIFTLRNTCLLKKLVKQARGMGRYPL